jgi:hypothetical protein
MGSFEEGLLEFQEADTIRREHALEGFSAHQLAFKHGLSYQTIKDILYYKIHKPETPAEAPATKTMHH